ncbi:MAG: type IV pili methyl-accepting chemotaxis transducer N-terminal domain-containing protein, partial [Burkholderiaceae bacterium]|nr:type IV pili methyl-accepting chemotaxis transducer N-terminal domain-containing protein [Burkholderiaceae bacterium]
MAALSLPVRTSPAALPPPRDAGMSLVNMAARQRMLSQRMVLQTVLAVQGSTVQLNAARKSLQLFTTSQATLVDTIRTLEPASADIIRHAYHGPTGVAPTIDGFARQVETTLEMAERSSPRVEVALERLVDVTDAALDALNTATTAFDQVSKAKSD